MLDNTAAKVRFVPVGETLDENMKYNLYYDPSSHNYQNHSYIVLYNDKTIKGIGKIICIADIYYDAAVDKMDVAAAHVGILTDENKKTIKEVIAHAYKEYGYELHKDHRFFLVDKFYETDFKKTTSGGMHGKQFFDISILKGHRKGMTTQEIADLLKGEIWT